MPLTFETRRKHIQVQPHIIMEKNETTLKWNILIITLHILL